MNKILCVLAGADRIVVQHVNEAEFHAALPLQRRKPAMTPEIRKHRSALYTAAPTRLTVRLLLWTPRLSKLAIVRGGPKSLVRALVPGPAHNLRPNFLMGVLPHQQAEVLETYPDIALVAQPTLFPAPHSVVEQPGRLRWR